MEKITSGRICWPTAPQDSVKKDHFYQKCVLNLTFPAESLHIGLLVSFKNFILYITDKCNMWDYVKGRVGKSSTVECCN